MCCTFDNKDVLCRLYLCQLPFQVLCIIFFIEITIFQSSQHFQEKFYFRPIRKKPSAHLLNRRLVPFNSFYLL